jgi:hypothetical protein
MPRLKTISTSQGYIHKYEDLKRKMYNCNANIHFNQKCLRYNTPSVVCAAPPEDEQVMLEPCRGS